MEKFCYHTCGYNLFRYVSIMKHGIVSAAKGKNSIKGFETNYEIPYNGEYMVSVAIPNEEYDNNDLYSSLKTYILDANGGISFYIEDIDYNFAIFTHANSGFYDEGFVFGEIPKTHIKGIIINSSVGQTKISELPIIGRIALNSVVRNAYSIINLLNDLGINVPKDIYQVLSQFNNAETNQKKETIIPEINRILSQCVEKYFQNILSKQDIVLIDVISYYNDLNLPIYNEEDVKKQCRGCLLPDNVMNRAYQILSTTLSIKSVTKQNKSAWREYSTDLSLKELLEKKLLMKNKQLSSLEAEESTISEAEALIDRQTEKEGQSIGEE